MRRKVLLLILVFAVNLFTVDNIVFNAFDSTVEESDIVETDEQDITEEIIVDETEVIEDLKDGDSNIENEGVVDDGIEYVFDENGMIIDEIDTSAVTAQSRSRTLRSSLASSFGVGYLDFSSYGGEVLDVYSSASGAYKYTYFNTGSSVFVPTLGIEGNRIKIVISGYVGYIDRTAAINSYVRYVSVNEANSTTNFLEKYSVNANGDLLFSYRYYGINTTIVVGKAPSFMNTSTTYYTLDGVYFYTSRQTMFNDWASGIKSNAINASSPYYNYYQYLPFRSATSLTADDFLNFLNSRLSSSSSSVLRNSAVMEQFLISQDTHGVNGALEVSMAFLESGYGTSLISHDKNNLFGWGAVDSGPYIGAYKFDSVAQGVDFHFKNAVSSGYLDNMGDSRYFGSNLGDKNGGLNVKYASDPHWGKKIAGIYYLMDKQAGFKDYNQYMIAIKPTTAAPTAYFNNSSIYQLMNNQQGFSISNMPFLVTQKSGSNMSILSDIAICNSGDKATYQKITASGQLVFFNDMGCTVNKTSAYAEYDFDKDIVTTSVSGMHFTGSSTPISPTQIGNTDVSASKITVLNDSPNSVDVVVSGVTSAAGVSEIKIAVWSVNGGQDDLYWYTATKQSGDTYVLKVNFADHNNDYGEYLFDVYGINGRSNTNFVIRNIYQRVNFEAVNTTVTSKENSFTANITGIPTDGLEQVNIATWGSVNGQNDLKWYTTNKNADGSFSITVDASNHFYESGTYHIHFYAKYENGAYVLVTSTIANVEVEVPEPEISVENISATQFKVKVVTPISYNTVHVPVWSVNGGQDDLVWYQASKVSNGVYEVVVDISNHKYTYGDYKIHVYGNNNGLSSIGHTTITVATMQGRVESSVDGGRIGNTVALSSTPHGIKEVRIAIWSAVNGQDDLKWYAVNQSNDGEFYFSGYVHNHLNDIGMYHIHVYGIDNNNKLSFIDSTKVVVEKPEASSINVISTSDHSFRVEISGIPTNFGINKIYVPVWSATAGQDDIKWYEAENTGNGKYVINVNMINHKNTTGVYYIHIYGQETINKDLINLGGTYTTIDRAITSEISVENISSTQFKVILVTPSSYKTVYIPIWSVNGGQDDLKWYQANKVSDGIYEVVVDISNHKYTYGDYKIHVYGNNNGLSSIGHTTTTIETMQGQVESSVDGGRIGNTVTLSSVPHGLKEVRMAIWSAVNGQDDIKWYIVNQSGDGKFYFSDYAFNHLNDVGMYHIHVYGMDNNNQLSFIDGASVIVEKPEVSNINVISTSENSFKVEISGIPVNFGIDKIYVPVWSAVDGQDDLKWYEAVNTGNGKYVVDVNKANHKNSAGIYYIHIYGQEAVNKGLINLGGTYTTLN